MAAITITAMIYYKVLLVISSKFDLAGFVYNKSALTILNSLRFQSFISKHVVEIFTHTLKILCGYVIFFLSTLCVWFIVDFVCVGGGVLKTS